MNNNYYGFKTKRTPEQVQHCLKLLPQRERAILIDWLIKKNAYTVKTIKHDQSSTVQPQHG